MKITGFESNDAIARELGDRVRHARIAYPLTQTELAERAGVSLKTVSNLESGRDVRLGSLISVLRALNMLANIEAIVPEHRPSPNAYFALGHDRRRAISPSRRRGSAGPMKWGDEQ